MQVVLLIYGLPACGKRTIAKTIAENNNMVLLDNHFFNNIVYPYVVVDSDSRVDISRYVYNIRQNFLDAVEKYSNKQNGYVFTNVLLDTDDDRASVESLKKFAKTLGYPFVAVHLVCDEKSVKERIGTPERASNYKLTDYDIYHEFVTTTKFMDLENVLTLDTSDKSISESAQIITDYIKESMEK